MVEPTEGHVVEGRDAGEREGTFTVVHEIAGRATSRGGRPGATAVLEAVGAKVVAFEFAAGDELREHAARHPILVQVIRGEVVFTVGGQDINLTPGQVIHLTPMLRHAVRAEQDATLTVTMLLPHDAS